MDGSSYWGSICRAAGLAFAVAVIGITGTAAARAAADVAPGAASGLPIPRFVSLKSDRVNVRAGPTKDHDVTWVYTRSGLPVEVTAEFENWRRIRDWEGAEGWVYHSMLSGKRTAIVSVATKAKDKDDLVPLHETASAESELAAKLQAGVLGAVKACKPGWCRIAGKGFDGWIQQERLWGVYPNEKVE
jgi:SH3-like domain-containing protein